MFLTVGAFLGWSQWAKIDQITRAPGEVIASSKTQVVQSQEGGILERLAVKEGDRVARGDIVAVLERTQVESAYLESMAKKAGLLATIARLRSEVFGTTLVFDPILEAYPGFIENQRQLFAKRQSSLNEEVGGMESVAALIKQELALNRPLLKTGDVSRADFLRLERQLAEMKSQITNVRNEYFRDAQSELNKLEEELASIEQQLKQREDKLKQTTLTAPVNGIVKNISIATEGGVIRPGEEIMQIVPVDDRLIIEAKVTPADIAFVQQGLPATVKIDAYDYTIYGDLDGRLTYISADTLREQTQSEQEPYYRIQVETEGRRFNGKFTKELEILPGMTAMVEIKTGTNTVLSYIIKPLVKTFSESLGER
ncbi:HlyD family type I secretion periplasmic adaptor subunit [Marinobacterium sp. xm-a-152]|jgi:adhesin transport system membrane fusion protein|uniref:HlyD family type I secretion periplasmic adaptor subunit n=1 Tax=Marinobacterium sp. xm-a-152 TaxID=2497733 RepID=UPI001C2C84F7|nr:HlyD family type I secretion periplasmic adaptor subunit [Marinobacterium sp. xm-a-152]